MFEIKVDTLRLYREGLKEFHVTDLAELMSEKNCKVKFFLEKILKIEPLKEIKLEPEPVEVGTEIHSFLENFWKKREKMEIEINKNFIEEIINEWEKENKDKILIFREMKRILLENFAKVFVNKICGTVKIKAIEEKITVEEKVKESINIKIYGKVDLILETKDYIYIVDYKTGAKPSGKTYSQVFENQVDLYAYMYRKKFENLKKIKTLLIYMKRADSIERDYNRKDFERKFKKTLEDFFRDDYVFKGNTNFCYLCNFKRICEVIKHAKDNN